MVEGQVILRKGREKPVKNRHPWIFSGAIAHVEDAGPGDIVSVFDSWNNLLGRGYWNKKSQIQVRMMTWDDEPIDEAWWRKMLKRAIDARYVSAEFYAGNRIVNAENDFIPGLVVDRYAGYLVLQALTLHIDMHKEMIARILVELFEDANMPIKGVYERSDVDVRGKEGLRNSVGVLWGEEPPELVQFREDNLVRFADVRKGHKTGYYLDQVDNHRVLAELAYFNDLQKPDASLLNAFSFTGGFGLMSSTRVINVDSSEEALQLAEHTYASNEWNTHNDVEFIQADVFEYLRDCVGRNEQHDIVILDPPKFASNKQQVKAAARGYKDINLHGFQVVKSGGFMMTFSCSGAIDRDLFQKIVFGALADSGREAQVIKQLGASEDHPNALTFPEGEYLKGLLLRVY